MPWFLFYPHVIILFLAAGICAWIFIASWPRRDLPGGRIFAIAMAAAAEWTFASAIEAGVVEQSTKILWSQIQYLGFNALPALLLIFILIYTQRSHWLNPGRLVLLWFFPAVTQLLVWTNSYHHLVWTGFSPGPVEANVLIYHHGVWFWIIISYLYLVFLLLNLILIHDFTHARQAYRAQIGAMILAGLFPAATGALYIFGNNPIPGLDWTPVGWAATSIIFAWSFFRLRLLDLIPVAREMVLEHLSDGVIVLDGQNRVVEVNPSARRFLGKLPGTWVGIPFGDLLPAHVNQDIFQDGLAAARREILLDPARCLYTEVQVTRLIDLQGYPRGKLILLHDITQHKHAEQLLQETNRQLQAKIVETEYLHGQLREQAIRDELTGLYNRRYLTEVMEIEFARAKAEDWPISVAMIDIDHFKQVNDTHGHKAGDLVLQALGAFLIKQVRRGDIACRYGGEEFVLVLPGMDLVTAFQHGEDWRSGFECLRLSFHDRQVQVTLSIGVAAFPGSGSDPESVLRAADQALYAAKAAGRNCIRAQESE